MKKAAFLVAIASASLLAHGQMEHPKTYDLLSVKWSLSFDEKKREIYGDVVNLVRPLNGSKKITFDAVKLAIERVTVDDKPMPFVSTPKDVSVVLPSVQAGKAYSIEIKYSGSPEAGVYFVPANRSYPGNTSMVYTQGEMIDTRYWMPTYDWPDNKATFEAFIETPKDYLAVSNGKLMDVGQKGDKAIYHWKLDQPSSTYLMAFVAGKLDKVDDNGGSVPTFFLTPQGLSDMGQQAFGGTSKIVDFYGRLTGFKYPYAKFSQAAMADYMYGGMENTSIVVQTLGAIFPASSAGTRDATELVAHELAHHWFGDTVTCVDWSQAWLNEGFASFLPPFWIREKEGKDAYDLNRLGIFRGGYYSQKGKPRSVVWNTYKEPFDLFDGVLYPGGASRLFMLMDKLGEPAFWKGIQAYLEANKFKNVDTDAFFNAMQKSSGVDLTQFKKQWIYKVQLPDLKATVKDGSLVIDQPTEGYEFPLDVWFWSNGDWVKKTMTIQTGSNTLPLGDLKDKPFVVDPEVKQMVPVGYASNPSTSVLREMYDHAPNAAQKSILLDRFFGSMTPADQEALLTSETVPGLRQQMAGAIATSDSSVLVANLADKDERVVLATLNHIAGVKFDGTSQDAVVARLKLIWKNSANTDLRGRALSRLLELTGDRALLAEGYRTDSYNESIRAAALNWEAANDAKKARSRCIDLATDPSTTSEFLLDIVSRLGQLKDEPGSDDVYKLLIHFAQDRGFSLKTRAIDALADYGDKRAIPMLETMKDWGMFFIRGSVDRALARLNK